MTTRIEATRLIPGRGEVVDNGVVIFADSAISYAGTAEAAPETPDAEVVATDTVMPGMWECHGHFIGIYTANIDEVWTTRPQLAAMRVTADARRALHAGFTSVRELGGLGSFLSFAVEEGQVEGPNVYASGSILSMTGGHGDVHSMDLADARRAVTRAWGEDNIVDGPDEARAGVRRMLRLGARVIKIHASGGVLSQLDDPHLPQFSKEELEAIVDEAARMERIVAAHTHGKRGMMAAVEAGIKTLEHGTYIDEEVADAMIENGVMLVPTRWVIEFLMAEGEKMGMPEYAKKKAAEAAAQHAQGMALAVDRGVKMALGTDIFGVGLWGRNGEELALMVDCGMTPLQAIEMATANGPDTLGPQAPHTGQLVEGMDADVICVSGDPSSDVSILGNPDNVTHVFKGGTGYKG